MLTATSTFAGGNGIGLRRRGNKCNILCLASSFFARARYGSDRSSAIAFNSGLTAFTNERNPPVPAPMSRRMGVFALRIVEVSLRSAHRRGGA